MRVSLHIHCQPGNVTWWCLWPNKCLLIKVHNYSLHATSSVNKCWWSSVIYWNSCFIAVHSERSTRTNSANEFAIWSKNNHWWNKGCLCNHQLLSSCWLCKMTNQCPNGHCYWWTALTSRVLTKHVFFHQCGTGSKLWPCWVLSKTVAMHKNWTTP